MLCLNLRYRRSIITELSNWESRNNTSKQPSFLNSKTLTLCQYENALQLLMHFQNVNFSNKDHDTYRIIHRPQTNTFLFTQKMNPITKFTNFNFFNRISKPTHCLDRGHKTLHFPIH